MTNVSLLEGKTTGLFTEPGNHRWNDPKIKRGKKILQLQPRILKDILILTGNTAYFPKNSGGRSSDVMSYFNQLAMTFPGPEVLSDGELLRGIHRARLQVFRGLISGQTSRGCPLLPRLLLRSPSSALEVRFVETLLSRCSHVDALLFHLRSSFLSSTPTSRSSRAFSSLLFELFWYLTGKKKKKSTTATRGIDESAVNYTIMSTYINKDQWRHSISSFN